MFGQFNLIRVCIDLIVKGERRNIMLGVVVITHGKLSDGLKDAAEVIFGTVNNIVAVNLNPGDDLEKLAIKIKTAIQMVHKDDGVIILVDLVYASPYNQAILVINELDESLQKRIYVIGGVNLPMLLETINHQILKTPFTQVVEAVIIQGKKSIGAWYMALAADAEDDDFIFMG